MSKQGPQVRIAEVPKDVRPVDPQWVDTDTISAIVLAEDGEKIRITASVVNAVRIDD